MTAQQLAVFNKVLRNCRQRKRKSAANSAEFVAINSHFDWIRPGVCCMVFIYGE